jgi:hypothetical protein
MTDHEAAAMLRGVRMKNLEPTQEPKIHRVHVRDELAFLEGRDLDKADSTGRIVEDLTYREDVRRHGTIRTEHTVEGKRIQVSGAHRGGRRNTRTDKLAEENDAAAAFANDRSERAGTVYIAERKQIEACALAPVGMNHAAPAVAAAASSKNSRRFFMVLSQVEANRIPSAKTLRGVLSAKKNAARGFSGRPSVNWYVGFLEKI